ncbi:hypothetical protein VNI00_012453 [Paramarasmius palmivorus]|uniref:DUF1776-domain-containing protein n=1 Tax=Paramarasmius palmivorus TaxID=297713 RepID=A0AAW0C637_9AGAR
MDKLESYLESLEELLSTSLEVPGSIRESVHQLWIDITRYGPPQLPQLPVLGDFEVPPPPPPPPPPSSSLNFNLNWKVGAGVVGVGAGLLVGYTLYTRPRPKTHPATQRQKQVIIILGADHPLATPLIQSLLQSQTQYIVICTVPSTSDVAAIENLSPAGWVRALVLDPAKPDTIPVFLRSLSSTLSRKFPLTAKGDVYANGRDNTIHSIISFLSLPSPSPTPLECLDLQSAYLPHLVSTHITPLTVIQNILPLLRSPTNANHGKNKNRNIIVCLPSTSHAGIPFTSASAMPVAATQVGLNILRREIHSASLTGKTEGMKGIRVVTVDIGSFSVGGKARGEGEVLKEMSTWTASEKLTYGPAFAEILGSTRGRRPSNPDVFVKRIVGLIEPREWSCLWLRKQRIAVGAGALTYRLASHLPTSVLDVVLAIPHFLVGVRNRLLPGQPFVLPPPATQSAPQQPPPAQSEEEEDTGSEAEVASNYSGDVSSGVEGVESSWVSLKDHDNEKTF